MREVRLLDRHLDPASLVAAFARAHPGLGGVCTFVGEVRGERGGVEALELTHYEPLTLTGIEQMADRACARFALMGVLIAHRIGLVRVGEPIVCVSAAARHRRAAIDAVDFAMDHLKAASWLWKRERRGHSWHWIAPRPEDHVALARWRD